MRSYGPAPTARDRPGEGVPGGGWTNRLGAYAVIPDRGGLLLARTEDPELALVLPGGGVDPGEAPVQALCRETREEIGWSIRPVRRLGLFFRFTKREADGVLIRKACHVYLCRPGVRLGPPSEPDHAPVRMPAETALALMSLDGERAFVADLLGRGAI